MIHSLSNFLKFFSSFSFFFFQIKTSEFFEEDRSFKDRPEPELILAALRSSAAAAALGVGEESKTLPAQIDDITNEGIRLEREDNKKMAEKKEKEKEKYLLAKPSKEKKPTKTIQSNDPVQEYDDIITRGGKSKDDIESTTDTVVDVSVSYFISLKKKLQLILKNKLDFNRKL